jgi:hypothetical protein
MITAHWDYISQTIHLKNIPANYDSKFFNQIDNNMNDVYNIKNSTLEELAKYVKNITNAPHVYLDIEKYRLLYNYYNKPNIILSEKINEDDKEILLRNLFLTIIYDYLKNGKIALLNFYNDDSFFINFINKYKRYTLPNLEQELIKNGIKIRFESIEIELSSKIDLENVSMPFRKVTNDTCAWKYRCFGCNYGSTPDYAGPLLKIGTTQAFASTFFDLTWGGFPNLGVPIADENNKVNFVEF